MKINENTMKGLWKEIKGEVIKEWGKLTDDELEQAKGDFTALAGLVQRKYGESQDGFYKKFYDILIRVPGEKVAAASASEYESDIEDDFDDRFDDRLSDDLDDEDVASHPH